jgi:hypothetical protein
MPGMNGTRLSGIDREFRSAVTCGLRRGGGQTLLVSAVREEGAGFAALRLVLKPRAASLRLGWPWAAIGRTFGAEKLAVIRNDRPP